MPLSEKAERVRRQFEMFSKLCGCIPTDNVEIWEDTGNDPPDIYIEDGDVGIEFTEFYHNSVQKGGSIEKRREDKLERLVANAEKLYQSTNSASLLVLITWRKKLHLSQVEQPKLDQLIVAEISRSIPNAENIVIELKRGMFSNPNLASCIEMILVTKLSDDAVPSTQSTWRSFGRGRIDVGIESLEPTVRKKEEDLQRIKKKCGTAWLVIVGSGESISSTIALNHDVVPGCITSQFNRVYLLDLLFNNLICLTADTN